MTYTERTAKRRAEQQQKRHARLEHYEIKRINRQLRAQAAQGVKV